jgi:hypothetical protein
VRQPGRRKRKKRGRRRERRGTSGRRECSVVASWLVFALVAVEGVSAALNRD